MDKMKIHLIQMKIDELLAVCDEHNNDPGELINILHAAQGIFGYLPREVHSGFQSIWSCDVLFVLYHDSEGEISYFRLSGNGLLCTWSRESLGRVPAPVGDQSWRDYIRRPVFIGLSTLCGGLRTGSGRHDCRKSLWTSDTRESAGYPFRILPVGASISDSSVVPMLGHNSAIALAQLCRNDGTAI